jgi:hypothetical protein
MSSPARCRWIHYSESQLHLQGMQDKVKAAAPLLHEFAGMKQEEAFKLLGQARF